MKFSRILFIVSACLPFLAGGCTKGDSDLDYGEGQVYIAQATSSGGLDNIVTVPYGWGENTYNFFTDGDVLKIYLSVARSGKIEDQKGFSVDVIPSPQDAQSAISSGSLADAVMLSDDEYILPVSVSVEDGTNFGTFYLGIPMSVLQDPDNAGKTLVAGVAIANPTAYTLSEDNTSVAVAVNVDKLLTILEE